MLENLPDAMRYALRDLLLAELDVEAPAFACVEGEPVLLPENLSPHEVALEYLRALWLRHVEEPPGVGFEEIDDLIRGEKGLGWSTADARNWKPNQAYTKNRMFAWCGATIARALGEAGLLSKIRSKNCASTVRLHSFCASSKRRVALEDILPGDVLVVSNGSKRQGEHIVMCDRVRTDGLIETIEGNARGLGPNLEIFEGVVKRSRPLPITHGGPGKNKRVKCPISGLSQRSEVVFAYRFLEEDFAR